MISSSIVNINCSRYIRGFTISFKIHELLTSAWYGTSLFLFRFQDFLDKALMIFFYHDVFNALFQLRRRVEWSKKKQLFKLRQEEDKVWLEIVKNWNKFFPWHLILIRKWEKQLKCGLSFDPCGCLIRRLFFWLQLKVFSILNRALMRGKKSIIVLDPNDYFYVLKGKKDLAFATISFFIFELYGSVKQQSFFRHCLEAETNMCSS